VPAINWILLVAVTALVVGFGSSTRLASAYGIAVTGTLTVDTLLFLVVARTLWRKPGWMVALGAAVFFTVDIAFLSANLTKAAHGGWFPLSVGVVVFAVLSTWKHGSERVRASRIEEEGTLRSFIEELRTMQPPLLRVPGTAVYLNARRETTPLALRAGVQHSHSLHEAVVIISIETTKAPYVPESERLVVDSLGYEDDGIAHVTARFGFQDSPSVPRLLELAAHAGLECDVDVAGAVYFLSHVTVTATAGPGMATWRKRLFVTMARNAASPVDYFQLPRDRTVTLGSQIEL
jgi:KUP system potassium uptake protein